MKKIYLILIITLFVITGFSQPQMKPNTGIIVGKVIDKNDNPLEFVNIVVHKQSDSSLVDAVATDTEGKFLLKNINYGTYYLEIKFLGFQNKKINNIEVKKEKRFVKIGQIVLNPADQELDEVVVTGQVSTVDYKIDKKVINVGKDIKASGGDATDALRNVPSVEVDVNGDVSLRGSSNFTVMINGKPSILDPNEALKQIPASNIDKIEIITNPSAKYDPDGDAGIINIITKNKRDEGFSGKIEAGLDSYLGYNGDVLLNFKKNKFNFFTEFDIYKKPFYMNLNQYRISYLDTVNLYLENSGEFMRGHNGIGGKFGFNYFINDFNTLTINGRIGQRQYMNDNQTEQHKWWSSNDLEENYFLNTSEFLVNGIMYDGNVDFEHKFNDKGHKLRAFAQYSYWEPTKENLTTTDTTNEDYEPLSDYIFKERTLENIKRDRFRFQLDYELPINSNTEFEAGYVYRYWNSSGDYHLENFDNNDDNWIEDSSYYNNMTLNRQIHAAYITLSGSFTNIFDYKLGLRTEYTDRLVSEEVTGTEYPIDRFNFFPTVHLSKQLASEQQIQASYSRRINRPRGYNLNPFPSRMDRYTIRQGNPALKPEMTHSFELNYMKEFGKSSITLETYYKQTKDEIDRIMKIDGEEIILIAENLNKDYAYGGEIMANLLLFKMIMLNLSTNLYRYHLDGTLDGQEVHKKTFTWNSKATIMSMLPTGTGIQIGGFYRAPTVTLDGDRQAMFVTFAGLRQQFFDKKLSVALYARDLFSTMKFAFTTDTDNLYTEVEFSSLHPSIGISVTYRINNYKNNNTKRNDNSQQEIDFGGEGMY